MLVAFCDQLVGELDVALLEGDAVAVADARVAQLPLDGVERMGVRRREEALDRQRRAGGRCSGVRWGAWSVSIGLRSSVLLGPSIIPLEPDGKTGAGPLILEGHGDPRRTSCRASSSQ